jgi:hypothetical protein
MSTEGQVQDLLDRVAALQGTVVRERLADELIKRPDLGDALVQQINDLIGSVVTEDNLTPPPPDKGLAQLVGVGPDAAQDLRETRLPHGVEPYDEAVASERIIAVADLYYIYQHEKVGVFRAIQKLQELFRAGTIQLSSGRGAYSLYQFDRREVLRYTRKDRVSAYRKAFGFGGASVPTGSRPNTSFGRLFSHFNSEVALFWRDKRISDVMRERAYDPSFGSIAVVRRAGLDLRNNLKFMSYGHLNVLRVEVMQLLDEAFRILGADDVKKQFGADTAWDVIESILVQHFNEALVTSPRQRMAVAGREVLRWLAQPHVLQTQRAQFEALLLQIAEFAEEWLTSAQSLGIVRRRSGPDERVLRRQSIATPVRRADRQPARLNGASRP